MAEKKSEEYLREQEGFSMSKFEDLILKDVDWQAEVDEVPPTAGDLQAPEDFADGAWDLNR